MSEVKIGGDLVKRLQAFGADLKKYGWVEESPGVWKRPLAVPRAGAEEIREREAAK